MWTVVFLCVTVICAVNGQGNRNRGYGGGGGGFGGGGGNGNGGGFGGGNDFGGETTTPIHWGGANDPRRHPFCDDLRNGTGFPSQLVAGCRHFLQCGNGIMWAQMCGAGSVNFDSNDVQCQDEPEDFQCDDNNRMSIDAIKNVGEVCFPGPDPDECHRFTLCGAAGEPVQLECGENTMYNHETFVCDHVDSDMVFERGCRDIFNIASKR